MQVSRKAVVQLKLNDIGSRCGPFHYTSTVIQLYWYDVRILKHTRQVELALH